MKLILPLYKKKKNELIKFIDVLNSSLVDFKQKNKNFAQKRKRQITSVENYKKQITIESQLVNDTKWDQKQEARPQIEYHNELKFAIPSLRGKHSKGTIYIHA